MEKRKEGFERLRKGGKQNEHKSYGGDDCLAVVGMMGNALAQDRRLWLACHRSFSG